MADSTQPISKDSADRGSAILIVSWIECGVAITIVAARVYTRSRIIHNIGIDDWMILIALVLAVICSSIVTADVYHGGGRHYATLSPVNQLLAVKLDWISQPFAIFTCGTGKISVAFLILRIMAKNKYREWFLYVLIALLVIINAICVGFIFGQCSPARKLWDQSAPGTCLDPSIQRDVAFFQSSFSTFTDFVLAIFPLIIIWNLQMRPVVKLGMGCAMSLGLVATGAAIVKTIQLQQLTARSDYTYETFSLIIWFTTEMYVIIIAACIPTLRPLVRLLHGRLASHKSSSGSGEINHRAQGRWKKGYLAQKDTDALPLRPIYPPMNHAGPNANSNNGLDTWAVGQRLGAADIERYPDLDSNEIVKTTEVNVSFRNQSVR
ncbi:MAG: hypothetical protein Q9195_002130 [Heterodermia aff. obscurata]